MTKVYHHTRSDKLSNLYHLDGQNVTYENFVRRGESSKLSSHIWLDDERKSFPTELIIIIYGLHTTSSSPLVARVYSLPQVFLYVSCCL